MYGRNFAGRWSRAYPDSQGEGVGPTLILRGEGVGPAMILSGKNHTIKTREYTARIRQLANFPVHGVS